ncbi:hypothetical protein [Kurthia massiliensis]|uniref:hypothetical protein n=1 Tax=Kurthia massiliensis TaxID=1033739 RepID=UPI00028A0217|nr:hypothetical protein [Kurthia massiliensis]
MKKWATILLASSLMFSTVASTTLTNDANAKESTTVETAAVKEATYKNIYFGDDKSTFKKKAKAKKWVFLEDSYRGDYHGLHYRGKVYGRSAFILVEFKYGLLTGMAVNFEKESKLTTWNKVQSFRNEVYRKINKDLKYKKSTTSKKDGNIVTQWKFKKKTVIQTTGYNNAGILYSKN